MKKLLLISLGIIIVILGLFLIYKYNKEDLKMRCTSDNNHNDPNLSYVLVCMERGNLYQQEQYDAYYNIAANSPPLSIIQDDLFYQGFSTAYRNCSPYSKRHSCDRHDEKIMNDFIIKCTQNANKRTFCTDRYFDSNNPNKENIQYFVRVVKNQLKEYELRNYRLGLSCDYSYKIFYNKIDKELMKSIPDEIKTVCNKE